MTKAGFVLFKRCFHETSLKKKLKLIKRDKTFLYNDCGMLSCTKPSLRARSGLDHSFEGDVPNNTRIKTKPEFTLLSAEAFQNHTPNYVDPFGFFLLCFPRLLIKQVQKRLPC